ncbi:hypothetical protein [Amycolatopsis cihanbeyliensis]|uniref:Uncharacterized protein n=1 Tax=Amycolatopsis cihanbeyliensis TaxID=1128664 RepID=A0A542DQD6_AMYCI|nr:hypothetical protein [Amycolatopsis cihanbeyliensis]TQJ05320.1 hypothetical protein FB471_5148 [Amycolatopsis cihanbeyliensis]
MRPAGSDEAPVGARRPVSARIRLLPALLCCCAVAAAVGLVLPVLQERLTAGDAGWPTEASWLGRLLGDLTEAQFYAVAPAGLGMLVLAVGAHLAARRGLRLRGFDISYGSGLLPWVVAAALGGLLLSHALWWWTRTGSWQPTFVPFVSVPPAVVLVYGAGWRVAPTAAVLGGVLSTPLALAAVNLVCVPLGLPNVVGNVTGMWSSALVAFALCRRLPWMVPPAPPEGGGPEGPRQRVSWLPRRMLADFTEAQFYGNEWASLGMLAGLLLAWAADPAAPVYGSGLLPALLSAQLFTAALGCWWHADRWRRHGWYPTFVPVVSLAPAAVLTYGDGWAVILGGAVIGALLGPPLARAIIVRLPADFHPFIGSVASMTVTTLVGIGIMGIPDAAGLL